MTAPGGRLRVLVVDDVPAIANAIRRSFRDRWDVIIATSGAEGLRILQSDVEIDVTFLDIMMPDVNGIAVYEALERAGSHRIARIVFMTAGAGIPRVESWLAKKPNFLVEKPFGERKLEAVALLFENGTGRPRGP